MRSMPSFALMILVSAFCSILFCADITEASVDVGDDDTMANLRKVLAELKEANSLAVSATVLAKERTADLVLDMEKQIGVLSKDAEAYHQRILKFKADQAPKETRRGRSEESAESWNVSSKHKPTEIVYTGGLSYVRWGRLNCDKPAQGQTETVASSEDDEDYDTTTEVVVDKGDATLLYSGSAATGKPTGGGGSELLCFPSKGLWLKDNIATSHKNTAAVYGLEYNFDNHPFNEEGAFRNQDVPCAVCLVQSRSHVITIPGKDQCPAGWITEYQGFLVSGVVGEQKGAYTCLDNNLEEIKGGQLRGAGGQLTPVMSQCGAGLSCPPFKRGHAFDCIVCSL